MPYLLHSLFFLSHSWRLGRFAAYEHFWLSCIFFSHFVHFWQIWTICFPVHNLFRGSLIRFRNCISEQCIARLPLCHGLYLDPPVGAIYFGLKTNIRAVSWHKLTMRPFFEQLEESKKEISCRGRTELISVQHWYLAQELAMSCGITPICNP